MLSKNAESRKEIYSKKGDFSLMFMLFDDFYPLSEFDKAKLEER